MAFSRREFGALAVVGAGSLLSAGSIAARAQPDIPIEKMKVAVGNVPSFVYGGFYVGIERGYFAGRGLEVELVLTRGGDTAFQIAGNTLQFAGGAPVSAFFQGLKRSLPPMAISPLTGDPPAQTRDVASGRG